METSEDKPAKDEGIKRAHEVNNISSRVENFLRLAKDKPDSFGDTEKGIVLNPTGGLALSLLQKLFPRVKIKAFNISCSMSGELPGRVEFTAADYASLTHRVMKPQEISYDATQAPRQKVVKLNLGGVVEMAVEVFENSPDTHIYISDLGKKVVLKNGQPATLEELQLASALLSEANNKRAARHTPDTRS